VNSEISGFRIRLESLRGIAALAVVITHASATFPIDGNDAFWATHLRDQTLGGLALYILDCLFSSGAAIVLFFVLSGYVLALSLRRAKASIGSYLVRRLFRLMPAMWVSIVIYALVANLVAFAGSEEFGRAFIQMRTMPPTFGDMLRNFVLMGDLANPVTWTMYVEMLGSICLPIFVALMPSIGQRASMLVLGLLAALTIFGYPAQSTSYIICFAAGAFVAIYFDDLNKWLPSTRLLFVMVMLTFILERPLLHGGWYWILGDTLAAALLLVGVLRNDSLSQFLEIRSLRFLGRISYSLYLIHLSVRFPVAVGIWLAGLSVIWGGLVANVLSIVLTSLFSMMAACVVYSLVELPAIKLGRRLSRASFDPSFTQSA
jgi:peptidoglycan/LPS O-acetylase OafA/YrhL